MSRHKSPLDNLKVAAPCTADWGAMTGGERVRFCARCELNVYNLSGMTRAEAEALVTNTEGRLCVRFFRREDGTILTENCPVGLRALKRRVSRVANAFVSAVLGFLAGLGLTTTFGPPATSGERVVEKTGRELPVYPHTMGTMIASPPPSEVPPQPMPYVGPVGIRGDSEGGYVTGKFLPENHVVPFEKMKLKRAKRAK